MLTHSQIHEVVAVRAGMINDSLQLHLNDWLVSRYLFRLERASYPSHDAWNVAQHNLFEKKHVSLRKSTEHPRSCVHPPSYEYLVGSGSDPDRSHGHCSPNHAQE